MIGHMILIQTASLCIILVTKHCDIIYLCRTIYNNRQLIFSKQMAVVTIGLTGSLIATDLPNELGVLSSD
jgi:hypothetical protein